ncbi:hypothetical protein B0A48_12778 [Cryoendolithus antarcticus]|uniref:CFEM domain-containing protein n=1 Tax=Cryoendolithus antarcticus TaxID=1507870 RepID=A0A1V8SRW0_9PEZI|nr:hypothetical protein B0A48_12778 [Cryoendolithus antarcticus]
MSIRWRLFALLALLFSLVVAQVGPLAQQLTPCIKSCDPAAISSVNCTNADQLCHCHRQTGILTNITACINVECQMPSADLHLFTTLFGEVCSQFNITVPVLGNGTVMPTSNVSGVAPVPTASVVPYTGAALHEVAIETVGLAVVLAGAILSKMKLARFRKVLRQAGQ